MEKNITISIFRIIATIFILICHIGTAVNNGFVAQAFEVGVQFFLFISGFLYGKKMIEKPFKWLKNRYIKIVFPALLYVLVCVVISLILKSNFSFWALPLYIFNVQGYYHVFEFIPKIQLVEGTQHLWFLTVLFICYVFVIIIKKINISKKVFFCLIPFVLIIVFCCSFFGLRLDYFLIFFIGYFFNKYEIKTNKISVSISFILMCCFVVLRLFVKKYCDNHGDIAIYTNIIIPLSCISITIFSYFFIDLLVIYLNKISFFKNVYNYGLRYFEKISYYVYLVHYLFLSSLIPLFQIRLNLWLIIIIFVIVSIVSAILLYFIIFLSKVIIGKCFNNERSM